ncbi:hypothetical protein HPP92_028958 [Vanilla planifolia]|uniref:Uncharacterized protein n=1 Tax=Vanilla planifolia TaxID=51239 RepID=A0A835U395_VANPL|nr:hypothetical protein HPP92_028958 [Vanilla planifolia]KAG0446194.1 hypothetical protein HPP92_028947 [Vanilla planifolia]
MTSISVASLVGYASAQQRPAPRRLWRTLSIGSGGRYGHMFMALLISALRALASSLCFDAFFSMYIAFISDLVLQDVDATLEYKSDQSKISRRCWIWVEHYLRTGLILSSKIRGNPDVIDDWQVLFCPV